MTPERWQQLEEMYDAVRELSPAERSLRLKSADPELRSALEAIFSADASTLDHAAWEGRADLLPTESGVGDLGQLGPFKIERKIGSGGMGQVLLAEDTRLQRKVALKMLHANRIADISQKRRFFQEARAVSALNHPNIVVLYDIAQYRGVDVLVMEYVAGKPLQDLIPNHGMPLAQIANIGAQLASALTAAHAVGLVHRDIKPNNIMVTADGTVKVLDFGIAKSMTPQWQTDAERTRTTTGVIVGTVAYMSPEQTRGERLDGRSDIFSFGTVLYQAATGCLPFRGNSMLETMHAIASSAAPPPSTLCAGLPAKFDALVGRCLAKLPAERPASAAELAAELRSMMMEAPSLQAPTGRTSIAVVPFLLRGGSRDDEFLPVALADAVIQRLNSSSKLLVRPMASAIPYAAKETAWTEVARELNVDFVVDGAIQRSGQRIRLWVHLHRAGLDEELYSAKIDGELDDLFGLQDRLSEGVYQAVFPPAANKVEVRAAEPATPSPIAYELFMRAAERVTRLNKWDTQSAIEMLTRATSIDPAFTEAWARLAQACIQMGVVFDSSPHWFEMAEDAVAKTLALDISHADALCARGQILWSPHHSYQNRQALRALNGALRLNPGCHLAQIWRGLILFHLGLYAEAKQGLLDALARNPKDPRALGFLGQTALYRGDYEKAHDFNSRALAADPTSIWPNIFFPTIPLYLGRPAEAVALVRNARSLIPEEPTLIGVEAMVAAYEGEFQKAEALAKEALSHTQSLLHTHHLWHNGAAAYAMCGKPDLAVPLLRRCAEMGLPNYLLFSRDPHLAKLRGDGDFRALLSELRVEHDLYRAEFGTHAD